MKELETLLQRAYPGCEVLLETLGNGVITGWVLWSGFGGVDPYDRHDGLWDVLRRELRPGENNVGVLFLQTPEERRELAAA